jgi:hypothetical protein
MTERFPIMTHDHDTPAQLAIIEGIQKIRKFIGPKDTERMVREFWEGRGVVAEDARLEADIAACNQQLQIIVEQIQQNKLRRQELAPRVEDVLKQEEEMQTFIDGFAKFVHSEEGGEASQAEAAPTGVRSSPYIPPRPTVEPRRQVIEGRSLAEFCDTNVQRPLGKVALIQGVVLPGGRS